ncbi:ABC transporter permease [Leucobacter sp. W1038]|uniref:ABC transporter permease n=1 Tax=Leucobacter sp. W1038 TaxID=3438281 RepID=UPI003D95FEC8
MTARRNYLKPGYWVTRLWLLVLLLAVWWVASDQSQSMYFPPLRVILTTFVEQWVPGIGTNVTTDLLPSLGKFIAGFLIAAGLGVILGTVLGLVPWLRRSTEPIVQFLRSLPPPVLLPVALLFWGITAEMNIAMIVIGAIWPTVMNTTAGVRAVSKELEDFSAVYRLNFRERLFKVILPSAGPQIFSGLRVTLQLSVILIVVSEMVAATQGVGYFVLHSQQTFAVVNTWTGTIVLGIIGYLASVIFLVLEKRALKWQYGMRAELAGS